MARFENRPFKIELSIRNRRKSKSSGSINIYSINIVILKSGIKSFIFSFVFKNRKHHSRKFEIFICRAYIETTAFTMLNYGEILYIDLVVHRKSKDSSSLFRSARDHTPVVHPL